MNLTRNIIGSIVFTVAVLALINSIGNILVGAPAPSGDDGHAIIQPEPEKIVAKPEPVPAPTMPVPMAEAPAEATEAPAPTPAPEVVASAAGGGNVALGEKMFRRKCAGCHPVSPDGANRTGPNLFAVVGRDKAAAEGYRYSSALKKLGGTWTQAELNTFIAGPRTMVPDTKMTFAGIKKADQRTDIIAYLQTFKN